MNAQGLFIKLTLLFTYCLYSSAFVLMETDSTEADRNLETRVRYLITILKKVNRLTGPSSKGVDGFGDEKLTTDDTAENKGWLRRPIDKSTYERVIDIQKKDSAILPPAYEWCEIMGYQNCRSGSS